MSAILNLWWVVQRDVTAGLSVYLPSFLPKLWQRPSAVVELALDSWRHILYLRLQGGAIQVCNADGLHD